MTTSLTSACAARYGDTAATGLVRTIHHAGLGIDGDSIPFVRLLYRKIAGIA